MAVTKKLKDAAKSVKSGTKKVAGRVGKALKPIGDAVGLTARKRKKSASKSRKTKKTASKR
jgi:hypothetical protein